MVNSFLFVWMLGAIVVGLVRFSTAIVMGKGYGKELLAALIGFAIPAFIFVVKNIINNHRKVVDKIKYRNVDKS